MYVGWSESRWTWIKWCLSTSFVVGVAIATMIRGFGHFFLKDETNSTNDELIICFELFMSLVSAIFVTIAPVVSFVELNRLVLHSLPLNILFLKLDPFML